MDRDFPLVSIVLASYNSQRTIIKTLNSIANQSYKNVELIFVNDGSTDDSLRLVTEFMAKVNIYMQIISRNNKGFVYSLVEGITESKGDFIARIDSDDIWTNDHVELIMKEFKKNESLVLVGSNSKFINENDEVVGNSNLPLTDRNIRKHMLKDNPFIHSSVIFKKKHYEMSPGYLNKYEEYITDYNLWFELSKHGQCLNIKEYTVLYRISSVSMSRAIRKCENYRSRLSIMSKTHLFYKKYNYYYYFQYLKIRLKILYHCYIRENI